MSNISGGMWIGIDVSKAQLDVAVGEAGEFWSAGNDEVGIAKTVDRLGRLKPERVVVESTGGLERQIVSQLIVGGVSVALFNPQRVREFAKSTGLLAKTDRLDARLLAHFGQAVKPAATCLPSEEEQILSALIARRRQLIDMRTAETNRLGSTHACMLPGVEEHLRWLNEKISELDQQIDQSIQTIPISKLKMVSCAAFRALGLLLRPF
jgi:transposase